MSSVGWTWSRPSSLVMYWINLHTHKKSDGENEISILDLSATDLKTMGLSHKYCSLSLHPWFLNRDSLSADTISIELNSLNNNVLAIGECGLDKSCETDFQLQMDAFEQMISISEYCQKPLIIHCVKAFDELLALKNRRHPQQKWILHGFRGKALQAIQLQKQGFYFSFGANYHIETIKALPLDSIFAETDDSGLSIHFIYKKMASDLSISVEELGTIIMNNSIEILKLKI